MFARVEMLYLIWAVAAAGGLYLLGRARRRSILRRIASSRVLAETSPEAPGWPRTVKAVLLLACMASLVVGVSGGPATNGTPWSSAGCRS